VVVLPDSRGTLFARARWELAFEAALESAFEARAVSEKRHRKLRQCVSLLVLPPLLQEGKPFALMAAACGGGGSATVAWRNSDNIGHTATGTGFDTGVISPGGTSASVTFAAAASNGYHCSIHPTMVGTLSITQ
jgi:hypothetical protein